MAKRILAAAHDPGGAHAMAPVLVSLSNLKSIALSIYAGCWAQPVFARHGLHFKVIEKDMDEKHVSLAIERERPNLLLTATSWGSNAEQALRNAADALDIPSVVLLDFWANYALRFNRSRRPLFEARDILCVMDQLTRNEMISVGFRSECITVTGHPYLEMLFRKPDEPYRTDRDKFLFMSQPDLTDGRTVFKEDFFRRIVLAADREAKQRNRMVRLDFKPHPKEAFTSAQRIASFAQGTKAQVRILNNQTSLLEILQSYEAVAGGTTMGLFEFRSRAVMASALHTGGMNDALKSALLDGGIRLVSAKEPDGLFAPSPSSPPYGWHEGARSNVIGVIGEHMP